MKWSVGIETQGDRVLSREEIVELADAVAASSGIATGIGTNRYGAQLLVEAGTRDEAIEKARAAFARAVTQAGLPEYPVVRVEAVGEDEDGDDADAGGGHGGGEDAHAGGLGEHSGSHGKDAGAHDKGSGGPGEDPGGRGKDSRGRGKDSGG